jgi:transcriptional regulator with XRE-family HTH domain
MASKKIIALRNRIGWSQAQMGRALGCSTMIISHWENGVRNPSGITSRFIALLLSLSDSDLKKVVSILENLDLKKNQKRGIKK